MKNAKEIEQNVMTDVTDESLEPTESENQASDNSKDTIEKESMPDMLDAIWEADDLGMQGGFMYYYPDEKK